MEGPTMIAALLTYFCFCTGSLYAMFAWQPDPTQIQGDGTQRTVKNKCMAAFCLGGPCAIAFWQSGDGCTGLCTGDAMCALIVELLTGCSPIGRKMAHPTTIENTTICSI